MAEVANATKDTLFEGAVALTQPARGGAYRVNVDAILLASFAAGRRAERAFDLGAGVGAVGLSLLHLDAAEHVTMIEVDPALAEMARQNARDNRWESRVDVVHGDVQAAQGTADLVVCNPPYVVPGRGRAPAPARARARSGPLDVFLDAARRLAGRRARVCFVYPALETTTLLLELRKRGLEAKRLRTVHPAPEARARVILVEAVAGKAGGLVIEPPAFDR